MSKDQKKPDVEKALSTLKDFQRRTVDYVFQKLYLDGDDRVRRFLVADEVGLGKTMVARGVVARAIDYLWDKRQRLDVVYICANSDIARQNVNRLNVTGQPNLRIATRMTLLPVYLRDLQSNKINFVSFTPGTSFDLRSSAGIAYERAMIYHILRQGWGLGNGTGPKNLLQGNVVDADNWRWRLDHFGDDEENRIDPTLSDKYIQSLAKQPEIRQRFDELTAQFAYSRDYTDQERADRNELIGKLRQVLARTCVESLEPDIVILDEFQRFKTLLDGDDEVARLAHAVFDHPDAKVLLLSATPYKMYTMYHEQVAEAEAQEDHYADFIRTVGFLFGEPQKTAEFERDLARYRRALLQPAAEGGDELQKAKTVIEAKLRSVMVRTERVAVTSDHDSMIRNVPVACSLGAQDLLCFQSLDRIAEHLEVGDTVEYWKSAPYLLNVMEHGGYKLKEEFLERVKQGEQPELAQLCQAAAEGLLSWDTINAYRPCDPGNAKLRTLLSNKVEQGSWQLLWVPPSLSYYRAAAGPYAQEHLQDFTKALVFSSWRVVPKVVAMLCSYEAERRVVTGFDPSAQYHTDDRRRRRPLLVFSFSQQRLTGMRNFCLLYPCAALAQGVDPMTLASPLSEDRQAPGEQEVLGRTANRIRELLAPVLAGRTWEESGPADEDWYWAALALLDAHYDPQVRRWLMTRRGKEGWSSLVEGTTTAQEAESSGEQVDSWFTAHVEEFIQMMGGKIALGRPPEDLVEVLAKVAIASPAVTSLRAMMKVGRHPRPSGGLLMGAAKAAMGFRGLFNIPETIAMIRSLRTGDDASYWRSVLDYCVGGNLQAVMDEYIHVLKESLGLVGVSASSSARQIGDEVASALSLRTASLEFDEIRSDASSIHLTTRRMRCRYALQFTDVRSEDGKVETRRDQVRKAFNSPFQPFILATTSIGQEGLDFHQYCHEIYHWNLPANPIDLEQREGRINRYKGHVIRRNVAQQFGLAALAAAKGLHDPWTRLFELARATCKEQSELVPYWVFEPAANGYKILRFIPALPLSRDVEHLENLRRTIVAYRMVLGQPRQEDLVAYLIARMGAGEPAEALLRYRIDLSPRLV